MFRNGWKSATAVAALAVGAGWAMPAHATNGYFVAGYDVQSKGMAGVGVSSLDGVGAAAANPALGVKAGNSAGACLSFFMPQRSITITGGTNRNYDESTGKEDSKNGLFEIPCLGANFQTNNGDGDISLLLYANGGMNTHYATNPFPTSTNSQTAPLGVDYQLVFLQPSYSRVVGHGVTLGGGPVFAMQRFKAQGLQQWATSSQSSEPNNVTNQGYDNSYGAGLKVGGTWDAMPWLTFGVAYQTRTWMTRFEKYAGLFAGGGAMDIPANVTEGITVRPIKAVDVSLEHERIFYGDVASIADSGQLSGLLGSAGGKGFGWQDMDIYRIGLQWKAMDDLALRTGYSHSTMFTKGQNALFNTIFPATVTDHASVGATYDITPAWSVSGAYTHAFNSALNGWNQNDSTQSVKLQMSQDEATVGFEYKW